MKIANAPFLDRGIPRYSSSGVYIFVAFSLAWVFSNVGDFKNRNQSLTANLFKEFVVSIIKFAKHFPNFTIDTRNWLLNTILFLKLFCNRACNEKRAGSLLKRSNFTNVEVTYYGVNVWMCSLNRKVLKHAYFGILDFYIYLYIEIQYCIYEYLKEKKHQNLLI